MTTLREAAQRALGALEILLHTPTARKQARDAIAALRAALAEQERGPGWCPIHQHYKPCEHNTAKQAQPVAWRYKPMVGAPWSLSDDGYYVSCKRDSGYIVQPLYTTPPAPQPLTIERLRAALVASRVIPPEAVEDAEDYDDGVTLARIEALYRRLG